MAKKKRPAARESADDLLTSSAAAQLAGLNRSHFSRLLSAGSGPACQRIPAGGRHLVLIRRGDLMAWIEARRG